MKTKIILLLSILLWIMTGCVEPEGKLTPSKGAENVYSSYTLPQGSHDYDDAIVELNEKYATLFLYRFEKKDVYFNYGKYITYAVYNEETGMTNNGYHYVEANEDYIGDQLELIRTKWLNFFPDKFLKKALPRFVFLVDDYIKFSSNAAGTPEERYNSGSGFTRSNFTSGTDYILVGWASERILTMTDAQKKTFKMELCPALISRAGIKYSDTTFGTITNYTYWNANWSTVRTQYSAYGLLDNTYSIDAAADWTKYVNAITGNSYEQLTAAGGILHPDVDVNGLIRQKYDVIIDYFMQVHDIDLQGIGNN